MVQGPSREEDPLKQLADKLRAKNGVEWRSSILQDQRVEFIRGKDLARYLRSHEEQLQPFVSKVWPAVALTPQKAVLSCLLAMHGHFVTLVISPACMIEVKQNGV